MVNKHLCINDVKVFLSLLISFFGFSNLERSILPITFKPSNDSVSGALLFFYSRANEATISPFSWHFEINSATKPL